MILPSDDVQTYLQQVPEERRPYFERLRQTLLDNLPAGYEEQMSYGMIGYVVPHKRYPPGYQVNPDLPLPFINLASQKHYIALYHACIYTSPKLLAWFQTAYQERYSHKLDMGKSCIRFRKWKAMPYELVGELAQKIPVEEWIRLYEQSRKRS